MIGLSTRSFDLAGALYLHAADLDLSQTKLNSISRRSTRTPTLDGGAVLYDQGFSAADRTLTVAVKTTSKTVADSVKHLVQTYSELVVSLDDGAYLCNPQRVYDRGEYLVLTLLIYQEA
ncbi:MAG: hypothetical protein V7731_01830 [Amphritea sp.]